jgi:hypothetical protein
MVVKNLFSAVNALSMPNGKTPRSKQNLRLCRQLGTLFGAIAPKLPEVSAATKNCLFLEQSM